MRIVSLDPGATDILVPLGLDHAIVGIGHDGDASFDASSVPVVTTQSGDSTRLDVAALLALAPDLIFAREDAGCGPTSRAAVRRAAADLARHPAVYTLAPRTVGDILSGVKAVGDATGTQGRARELLVVLRSRIDRVTLRTASVAAIPRVVCLAQPDPPRTAGLWVPELVGMAGGHDVFGGTGRPSRPTTWNEVIAAESEVLVLIQRTSAPTGLPDAAGPGWPTLPAARTGRVYAVEPLLFTRPGPRIVDALETLAHHLHPGLFERDERDPPVHGPNRLIL